mmetsp:Transcript_7337/g.13248  ORF Transcript_7337/g.13248 Transcript_7337/m.13248 type:complete len:275 (-) Transcript_7337:15-839(-)
MFCTNGGHTAIQNKTKSNSAMKMSRISGASEIFDTTRSITSAIFSFTVIISSSSWVFTTSFCSPVSASTVATSSGCCASACGSSGFAVRPAIMPFIIVTNESPFGSGGGSAVVSLFASGSTFSPLEALLIVVRNAGGSAGSIRSSAAERRLSKGSSTASITSTAVGRDSGTAISLREGIEGEGIGGGSEMDDSGGGIVFGCIGVGGDSAGSEDSAGGAGGGGICTAFVAGVGDEVGIGGGGGIGTEAPVLAAGGGGGGGGGALILPFQSISKKV